MMQEFKEFAMKGNVVDMAVGVVIGAAFGKIVSSMVNDIIMPLVGLVLGGIDFTKYAVGFDKATKSIQSIVGQDAIDAASKAGASVVKYGSFLQNVIDFVIVAFAIFMAVRMMNKMRKQAPPAK
ncbi:MAG: large conductance mechanosensitive channel protein MscL [Planctomycetes bacterium]|nr:large conductance mechanosensitive channel protein MscL [Planctomycetota bacterium]